MSCIIFCAADFDGLIAPIAENDYVIAADAGLRHARNAGITPDLCIGDFDSLGFTPADGVVYPVEKDDTDAMLAVKQGLALGHSRFLIYGGLGGSRLDHTVANFQTLHYLADHDARGVLVGSSCLAAVIRNDTLRFPAGMHGDISVFCVGPDAAHVSIEGLYYAVRDTALTAGFPLGVSNHFTGNAAAVSVTDGALLIIWSRQGEREDFYGL